MFERRHVVNGTSQESLLLHPLVSSGAHLASFRDCFAHGWILLELTVVHRHVVRLTGSLSFRADNHSLLLTFLQQHRE